MKNFKKILISFFNAVYQMGLVLPILIVGIFILIGNRHPKVVAYDALYRLAMIYDLLIPRTFECTAQGPYVLSELGPDNKWKELGSKFSLQVGNWYSLPYQSVSTLLDCNEFNAVLLSSENKAPVFRIKSWNWGAPVVELTQGNITLAVPSARTLGFHSDGWGRIFWEAQAIAVGHFVDKAGNPALRIASRQNTNPQNMNIFVIRGTGIIGGPKILLDLAPQESASVFFSDSEVALKTTKALLID